ncbi:hypothetical protein C8R44DRAFT_783963 [Mycena epipterygia]|nr:hypothetical protein C8R44DRAFT_783963 [Mycena epipterygia]
MTNWAVFVTAPRPSPKALNRAFLLIQDFQFIVYPHESSWTLLTSKELPIAPPTATRLPLADISRTNDFAAMSFAEINAFVRAHDTNLRGLGFTTANWVIIDRKGLETSTCLVCDQYYNGGEAGVEGGFTDEFRACRIPYEEAWIMFANLDVANMEFEDIIDLHAGKQEDGSWKWTACIPDTNGTQEKSEVDIKREKALRELRDGGYAD